MEAVSATTPLQGLFEGPTGNLAQALAQHLALSWAQRIIWGISEGTLA